MRSIRLVAGVSSPVPSVGDEIKMNVEKHESSLLKVFSDVGSTPTASTNIIYFQPVTLASIDFSSSIEVKTKPPESRIVDSGGFG